MKKFFTKILSCNKPGEAKELGRKVRNFDPGIWDSDSFALVVEGNFHKFSQHAALREYLLQTGERVIVEASPVDTIWGIELASDSKDAEHPGRWKGKNLLGFALMEVRERLRHQTDRVFAGIE